VLVAAIVGGCIAAGFWQLRRLDDRRASNAQVIERSASVTQLPDAGFAESPGSDDSLVFRRVRVSGTFDAANEMLVRFRTRDGSPGYEVVTPLVTEQGVVLVDRGWVPLALGDGWPAASAAPPVGEVEVEGLLAPPEGGGARIERRSDRPITVGAIDVEKLRSLLPYDRVYRVHVLAERGATGPSGFPVPVNPPDLGEGPHLSYAVQWFCFATVGIVGWALLLRRRGPLRRGHA
jgi:cytochrome oxidase assembly protein ShyY1